MLFGEILKTSSKIGTMSGRYDMIGRVTRGVSPFCVSVPHVSLRTMQYYKDPAANTNRVFVNTMQDAGSFFGCVLGRVYDHPDRHLRHLHHGAVER